MRRLTFSVLAVVTLAPTALAQQLTLARDDSAWTRALRVSNFAFLASVVSVRATSTASVIAGRRTMVVRTIDLADSATQRPAGFRPLGVRDVTVVMHDTTLPQPGAELYVFAAGLASDSGLAVREIAYARSAPGLRPGIIDKVARARHAMADGTLRSTLKAATGVWLGRVDSVQPLALPRVTGDRYEFGASEAVVRIHRRFAGGPPAGTQVRIIVVASARALGVRNPSVRAGDVAIFAPSRPVAPFNHSRPIRGSPYVIVLPDQVIPASDSSRVKALLP